MRIFLSMMIISLFFVVNATPLAKVLKVNGIVKLQHSGSIKKEKLQKDTILKQGDIITTYRKAMVVLEMKDHSKLVLDQKTTIAFLTPNQLQHTQGKAFYKITSRDPKKKLKIKTDFAIIGIKGTTFIISADKNNSYVALKEGLIGVESIKEAFNLYKKKMTDAFEAYKKEQERGFQTFKKQYSDYILEVTKSFDLPAGNVVRFESDAVVEDLLKTSEDFSKYEQIISE